MYCKRLSDYGRLLVVLVASTLAACAMPPSERVETDLVEVHPGYFDQVYMQPDTNLPRIQRVAIAEPVVEMNQQWLRTFRTDYTKSDLARIRADYGRFLKEELAKALQSGGVEVVDSPEDADLLLRAHLRKLNIYGPDLIGQPARTDYYIERAGNATLDLEFVDAASDRVLARFVDHRESPPLVAGRIAETNRATNNRLFRRLMQRWSHNLVDYLRYEGALERVES